MNPAARPPRVRRAWLQSGSATLEAALVTPLMLYGLMAIIMVGVLAFGRVFVAWAVGEGARQAGVGAAPPSTAGLPAASGASLTSSPYAACSRMVETRAGGSVTFSLPIVGTFSIAPSFRALSWDNTFHPGAAGAEDGSACP